MIMEDAKAARGSDRAFILKLDRIVNHDRDLKDSQREGSSARNLSCKRDRCRRRLGKMLHPLTPLCGVLQETRWKSAF